jgi:hypothetical protein
MEKIIRARALPFKSLPPRYFLFCREVKLLLCVPEKNKKIKIYHPDGRACRFLTNNKDALRRIGVYYSDRVRMYFCISISEIACNSSRIQKMQGKIALERAPNFRCEKIDCSSVPRAGRPEYDRTRFLTSFPAVVNSAASSSCKGD